MTVDLKILHTQMDTELTNYRICIFQNFFRLSPGFCFADGLSSLALLRQDMKNGSGSRVFDWNVTGASLCYLAAEVLF